MGYTIVGEQIQKFRKEKALTQRELGERIGVSGSAVSQWESGGTPDISLLPALSDVLGVTVDALFGRTGAAREDMAQAVEGYIDSLPEDRRWGEMVSLVHSAIVSSCMGKNGEIVNIGSRDFEETYLSRRGSLRGFLREDAPSCRSSTTGRMRPTTCSPVMRRSVGSLPPCPSPMPWPCW